MYRIDNSTAISTEPAAGTPGTEAFPTDGNPGTATPATIFPAYTGHMLIEELRNLVAGFGITPAKAALSQVFQGIRRIAAGNITTGITANTTLTADQAGLVRASANGGSITLTLPAANAINGTTHDAASTDTARSNPLTFIISRTDTNSANTLTIARAGADTIGNGAISYPLAVGETVTLCSDASSNWVIASSSRPGFSTQQVLTGASTFTVPNGVNRLRVRCVGGGGGGGGASGSGGAGGGGGGGYCESILLVTPGQSIAYSVGAAGTGGSTAPANGTAGGSTTFGALTASGGAGGKSGASNAAGDSGSAGTGSGGTINEGGQSGGAGLAIGSVFYGGYGGSSALGGGGAPSAGVPSAGNAAGGGGAGGANSNAGANGAAGTIIVEW